MKSIVGIAAIAALAGSAVAAPASFIDLGVIGGPGDYSFDTVGSENLAPVVGTTDTELAIWDAAGILLDSNDDIVPGNVASEININLAPGEYFLATSEFNSLFLDNFINDVVAGQPFEAGESANVVLNINGSLAGSVLQGNDPAVVDNQTQFWRVEVIPAPGAAGLLGLAGLAAARRRR